MANEKKAESFMTIADLWHLCIDRWRWFVASVFVCLVFAIYYLLTTPYLYTRQAAIMVREESMGKNSTETNTKDIDELGFVNQKNNVINVVRHIKSLDVLMEVVQRMDSTKTKGETINKAKEIQSRLTAEIEELG